MRQRIKTITVNGKAEAVREYKDFFGRTMSGVKVAHEDMEHAKMFRSVYGRTTTKQSARQEKANRHAAFMAMPKREYKQVYGI